MFLSALYFYSSSLVEWSPRYMYLIFVDFFFNFFRSHRIEGGIGTVLKFWPIKAYRPCPQLVENGGVYTRSGQGLDEIAFGRDSKYDPMN